MVEARAKALEMRIDAPQPLSKLLRGSASTPALRGQDHARRRPASAAQSKPRPSQPRPATAHHRKPQAAPPPKVTLDGVGALGRLTLSDQTDERISQLRERHQQLMELHRATSIEITQLAPGRRRQAAEAAEGARRGLAHASSMTDLRPGRRDGRGLLC